VRDVEIGRKSHMIQQRPTFNVEPGFEFHNNTSRGSLLNVVIAVARSWRLEKHGSWATIENVPFDSFVESTVHNYVDIGMVVVVGCQLETAGVQGLRYCQSSDAQLA
jgi:hypothetical protein